MTALRRLVPRAMASEVLGVLQETLELARIVPPTLDGQPLMLWFSPRPTGRRAVACVVDEVVDIFYLLVAESNLDPASAEVIDTLALVTEDEILARSVDDPWDAADVAVQLGIVAEVPWSDAVEAKISALECHEEIGVEASARLARQYRTALEQSSAPGPDPSAN